MSTFERYSKKFGFRRRVLGKKQVRARKHRLARLSWVRTRRLQTVPSYWKRIIFSDECTVKVGQNFRVWVWKKNDEGGHRPVAGVTPATSTTRFSINVWGCITYFGQGYLKILEGQINAEKYLEVLDECLWSTVQQCFPDGGYIFQEDNAPIHKANVVKRYFQEKNTTPFPWPSYSPDLSPIENCWSLLKMRLQKEIHQVKSNADLAQRVTTIWASLPLCYFKSLYESIPKRLRAVQIAKGHLTKYSLFIFIFFRYKSLKIAFYCLKFYEKNMKIYNVR